MVCDIVTTGGGRDTGAMETVAMDTGVPATAAIDTGTVATLAVTVRRVPAAATAAAAFTICWGVGVWAEVICADRGWPPFAIATAGTVRALRFAAVRLEPILSWAF